MYWPSRQIIHPKRAMPVIILVAWAHLDTETCVEPPDAFVNVQHGNEMHIVKSC